MTSVPAEIPRPYHQRSESGFDVWADEYVRNESKAASTAGALRRLISSELRALPAPAGRVLHASYAGQRSRGTDVENLLFNNLDQTLSLFGPIGRFGVRFEDLGLTVPRPPDGRSRESFYSYRMAQPGEPFATVEARQLICRVPEAFVPGGPARLAARIWLAARRARLPRDPGVQLESGNYLLRIAVCGLDPAKSVKAVVDGTSAAMQRDDPERVTGAITRMSALLDVDEEELLTLVTAPGAPLGTRSRSKTTSNEGLFTLDGNAQVRVTPDDDRCVAAEVVATGDDEPQRLTVEVYSAKRR